MVLNGTVIAIVIFILSLWLIALTAMLAKAYTIYKNLTKDISQKDLANILNNLQKNLKDNQKHTHNLQSHLEQTITNQKTHIQKLGFVRYNPFGNTGGDQSFCLALLDEQDDGILITSLHTRDQTRLYTKMIIKGKSEDNLDLSKEEKECIKNAINWSKKK